MDSLQKDQSDQRYQYSADERTEKRQFSFYNFTKNSHNTLQLKYKELAEDLEKVERNDLIELLLEEIDQNEKSKQELWNRENKINSLEQEQLQLKQTIKKKRQSIAVLCETETKNLNLIEKLQTTHARGSSKNSYYEKKYNELSQYMSQYIHNINEAQEEFRSCYGLIKKENARLYQKIEIMNHENLAAEKRCCILTQNLKRYEREFLQTKQREDDLKVKMNLLDEENSILRKQVEVFQENIRITDRLEAQYSHEGGQLSSELDFIREKISQNNNISRDLIEKFQESSANIEKVSKIKDKISESFYRQMQKTQELQKQVSILRKKNQMLSKEVQNANMELQKVIEERQQIQSAYEEEKINKDAVKRQLVNLAQKVRYMENTYKKQLEQTQKIKGQLHKYWQSKEKRENSDTNILCQLSQNKTHQKTIQISHKQEHSNSQSTLSGSKMDQHSKIQSRAERRKLQYQINNSMSKNEDSLGEN